VYKTRRINTNYKTLTFLNNFWSRKQFTFLSNS